MRIDLVGTSPLILQPTEDEIGVKEEIVTNFKKAFFAAKKIKKISHKVELDVEIEINLVDTADKVDQRIGIKKYEEWRLILVLKSDQKKVKKEDLLEIIELAAGRPPQ